MSEREHYAGELARTDRPMIRAEVIKRLRDLDLAFGKRVFANRARALSARRLPACSVYTLREDITEWCQSPRIYERKLELAIEIVAGVRPPASAVNDLAQATDGLDDQLDLLAREVEMRLERDVTLGGLVSDIQHKRVEYDPGEDGEERYGVIVLIEEVTYRTEAAERPEAGFEPLREVQLQTNVGDAVLPSTLKLSP